MINIYTDGSSLGNPGKSGAAAVFYRDDTLLFSVIESESNSTNGKMELLAMKIAIEYSLEINEKVEIYTDSNYVLQGVTKWSINWNKNNWKKSDGDTVKFKKLWKEIYKNYNSTDKITIKKVKAHSGNIKNDMADSLAKFAAERSN